MDILIEYFKIDTVSRLSDFKEQSKFRQNEMECVSQSLQNQLIKRHSRTTAKTVSLCAVLPFGVRIEYYEGRQYRDLPLSLRKKKYDVC